MSRRRKPAEQPALIVDVTDVVGVASTVSLQNTTVTETPPRATQVERANALARARDEGEREGHIAGMAEAAAICDRVHDGGGEEDEREGPRAALAFDGDFFPAGVMSDDFSQIRVKFPESLGSVYRSSSFDFLHR